MTDITAELLAEIEQFYTDIERIDSEYTRPENYIERYCKVMGRTYRPAYLSGI